jgi:hypothetical protein
MRPHGRDREFEVAWVGEGWRSLVAQCHDRLSARFPGYELLDIKQKHGILWYQAFPRRWVQGQEQWTQEEADELNAIVDEFQIRSQVICEWCGAAARLREWRAVELTLCDDCDRRFPDPPVRPHHA